MDADINQLWSRAVQVFQYRDIINPNLNLYLQYISELLPPPELQQVGPFEVVKVINYGDDQLMLFKIYP